MKNLFVSLVVAATALLPALASEARPIWEGRRYWEFSSQEVNAVRNNYGPIASKELDRRCNEGHRTQNKPFWRIGRFASSNNRFFCRF